MNIICTQENLKAGLLTVGRIISPSNTLPILSNILLKTENGLLKIFSTNLEIAISTHIRCKVEEEGEITVFSKTFTDLVANLPNTNISLKTVQGELLVETEHYHTSIKTMPADEFPLIPEPEGVTPVMVPAQDLKNSISEVVFAVSTNQTQPEISGVFMELEKNELILAATDRYRLAEKKITLPKPAGFSKQCIVPQKTMVEISRLIGIQENDIELVVSDSQLVCRTENAQVISRLIDGQYPPYRDIIPQEFLTTIHTSKQGLVNALKAVGIFSQNSNSIKLEYDKEKQVLTITSQSQDIGSSIVDLPSEVEGGSGELLLNHKYILDALANMESQNVIIKIINDTSPTVIIPEGKTDYLCLVMPIKI